MADGETQRAFEEWERHHPVRALWGKVHHFVRLLTAQRPWYL